MNVSVKDIDEAAKRLDGVVNKTPLQFSKRLSNQYGAKIYIKREDLQEVRSFKIRGAYNKMSQISAADRKKGIVCASAGNHAQGVAYSCFALKIKGVIFMPVTTPNQKVEKVKQFGDGYVTIKLTGDTFDDAYKTSLDYVEKTGATYIHPFNDVATIAGQGTVGKEIWEKLEGNVDVVLATEGGGGLISGVSTYMKGKNKNVKVYGVEPEGAASMHESLKQDKPVTLATIDTFVDGAAVKMTGDITFGIIKKNVDKILTVPEGKICTTMIELYQNEGIIAEPAGATAISALDQVAPHIKGKTVVCVLSGGNNDLLRYPEIVERSLVWLGRKHYFIVEFAQKPGQLKKFLSEILGPNDDIVLFEYMKKNNKEKGPALVGIELKDKKDLQPLLDRFTKSGMGFKKIDSNDMVYKYLV